MMSSGQYQVLLSTFLFQLLFVATILDQCLATPRCELARIKCAHRMGCGMALHSYMVDCADLIAGKTAKCNLKCQRALIALVSSDEGQTLMECDCGGSSFCELNKERVEVCRPEVVEATAVGTVVSCATARWICLADPLCSTAMDYYNRFCRGMFKGSRCSARCKNSLDILNRQEKAAKLRTCYCDGTEDFACQRIKSNTERLCYGIHEEDEDGEVSNGINVLVPRMSSAAPTVTLPRNLLLLGWFSFLCISCLSCLVHGLPMLM